MSVLAEKLQAAIEAKEAKAWVADSTVYDDNSEPVTAAGSLDWHVEADSLSRWVADGSGEKVALAMDVDMMSESWDAMTRGRVEFIADNDPASVLRRCAADREIVDEYRKAVESHLRRPDDAVLFERHLCWKVALEISARGYGLEVDR